MKAKELMLGDWVNVAEFGIIDQIMTFTPDTAITGHGDTCGEYEYERLAPIPLTGEILARIGFKCEESHNWLWWRADCRKFCVVKEEDGWYFAFRIFGKDSGHICISECNYVHELQHALRLVGVTTEIEL